jgi:succinate dehydrogenase/fumarate reductase flavoprotein subunit
LQSLADLLVDGKAAQKKIAEFAAAVDKAREAEAATKKAEASRVRIFAELDAAQKEHDERLASALATHTVEIQRRAVAVEQREAAADQRGAELDRRELKIKADNDRLDKKAAAFKALAE